MNISSQGYSGKRHVAGYRKRNGNLFSRCFDGNCIICRIPGSGSVGASFAGKKVAGSRGRYSVLDRSFFLFVCANLLYK